MAFPAEPIELTVTGGLDQSKAIELLQPGGGFLKMENCYVDKAGAARKPDGFQGVGVATVVDTDPEILDGRHVSTLEDEPVLTTKTDLYAWSPVRGAWAHKGPISPVQVREFDLFGVGQSGILLTTCATLGDLTLIVAVREDDHSSVAVVRDERTGTIVLGPQNFGPSGVSDLFRPQAFAAGDFLFVLFGNRVAPGAVQDLDLYGIDTSAASMELVFMSSFVTDAYPTDTFSVCASPDASLFVLAYKRGAAGTDIVVRSYDVSGALGETVFADSPEDLLIDVHVSGTGASTKALVTWTTLTLGGPPQRIRVARVNNVVGAHVTAWGPIDVAAFDATAVARMLVVVNADDSTGLVAYSESFPAPDDVWEAFAQGFAMATGSTAAHPNAAEQLSCRVMSRPIVYTFGGAPRVYVACEFEGNPEQGSRQTHYYLAEIDYPGFAAGANSYKFAPVAHFAAYRGRSFVFDGSPLFWYQASTTVASGGVFRLPAVVNVGTLSNLVFGAPSSAYYTQIVKAVEAVSLFDFDFESLSCGRGVEAPGGLFLPGGIATTYDGEKVVEAAFLQEPPIVEEISQVDGLLPVGTTGLAPGAYQYAVTYVRRYKDRVVRSRPSSTKTIIVDDSGWPGNGTHVTIKVRYCNWSVLFANNKDANAFASFGIEIWRSSVNEGIMRRLPDPIGLLQNLPSLSSTSQTDTFTDAEVAVNAALYTTAELANDPPPPPLAITTWRQRIWTVYKNQVWYTKEVIAGRVPEWSAAQVLEIPAEVTAIGATPDFLLVFTRDEVYRVSGWGPNDAGQGSTLTPAERLPGDVGAHLGSATLHTRFGVVFATPERGIWTIGGDGASMFLGEPIRDVTDSTPLLAAMAHDPGTDLVWCALNRTQPGEIREGLPSLRVLLDLNHGQWSTMPDREAYSVTYAHRSHGDGDNRGLLYYLSAGGGVKEENPGAYDDDGLFVEPKLRFPWMKPAGVIGHWRPWRLYVLGRWFGECDLSIHYGYDYGEFETDLDQVQQEDLEDLDGFAGADSPIFVRRRVPRSRATSLIITLTQTADGRAADSRGMDVTALRLEFGVLQKGRNVVTAVAVGAG